MQKNDIYINDPKDNLEVVEIKLSDDIVNMMKQYPNEIKIRRTGENVRRKI